MELDYIWKNKIMKRIPLEKFKFVVEGGDGESLWPEAGVLKKLSLAGLAKLRRLRYSWQRFGLASAGYRGLWVHDRPVYTAG